MTLTAVTARSIGVKRRNPSAAAYARRRLERNHGKRIKLTWAIHTTGKQAS